MSLPLGVRVCDRMLMMAMMLGLTLALPATGAAARFEAVALARLEERPITLSTPAPPGGFGDTHVYERVGQASLGVTFFSDPVEDDDAPIAVQSFLQRATRLHLGGTAGGGTLTYPPVLSAGPAYPSGTNDITVGNVGFWADGYLRDRIYLATSVALDYRKFHYRNDTQTSELAFPMSATVGLRLRDVLLAAGWSIVPVRIERTGEPLTGFNVRFWGGAFVRALAVVRRTVEIGGRVALLDSGASASLDATWWLRRRLGFSLGIDGGRGRYTDVSTIHEWVGGRAGISCWLSRSWALEASYAPTWNREPAGDGAVVDESDVAHTITVTALFRR